MEPTDLMRKKPFAHQLESWLETRDLPDYAIFWEQGTGKSKLAIDTACWMHRRGQIDALVIVASNGVHSNWTTVTDNPETWGELQKHVWEDVPYTACTWHTSRASTRAGQRAFAEALKAPGLAVLSISYDAAGITKPGKQALWDFLRKRKCLMVLDESLRIGTPGTLRTDVMLKAGRYAVGRRIMTGTPVSNSPFSVYSQMRFLDPDFWKKTLGIGSHTAFEKEFGIIRRVEAEDSHTGRAYNRVVGYQNLEVLHGALASASTRVLKEDVLDLPPKVYKMRYFEMNAEQKRVYKQLRDEALAWIGQPRVCEACEGTKEVHTEWEGKVIDEPCPVCDATGVRYDKTVTAAMAVTRLIRLQQVTSGFARPDDTEAGVIELLGNQNPRVEATRDISDEVGPGVGQIVWARFQHDVDVIAEALRGDNYKVCTYDGRTGPAERERAKNGFQDGTFDRFIANQAAASEGLTLHRAKRVTYFSNTLRLVDRLQSEDRAHRIGQTDSVLYDDLAAEGTVDLKIIGILRNRMDVAGIVNGDRLKEWLI